MPARDLDACFYASEVPGIEFREGMFLVSYNIGKCHFEFAMAPNIYLKAVRLANKVADEFHTGKGAVVTRIRKKGSATH